MSESEKPVLWERLAQGQVDDLIEMLPKADINLENVDISQGRMTQGRDKFWMWDTDGHRIDFEICRIKGHVGKLINSRSDEPDPERPDALLNDEVFTEKKKKPKKVNKGDFGW